MAAAAPLDSLIEEHLATALQLKEEGNKLLAEGQARKAVGKYMRILAFVKAYLPGLGGGADSGFVQMASQGQAGASPEQKARALELFVTANSNAAAAALQLEDWSKAKAYADAALERRPDNLKVLLRRAKAVYQLGHLANLERDLAAIQELDKDGEVVNGSLYTRMAAFVQQKRKRDERALAKKMQQMFA